MKTQYWWGLGGLVLGGAPSVWCLITGWDLWEIYWGPLSGYAAIVAAIGTILVTLTKDRRERQAKAVEAFLEILDDLHEACFGCYIELAPLFRRTGFL